MSEISRYRSDPSDDRDFQQFAGAFDRPIAPAPTFAESLRRQADQSPAPARADRQPANARLVATGAAVTTFVDRRPRRIGFSILEIAAALLLVSALALSAYIINAVGRPFDPENIVTSDQRSQRAGFAATPDLAGDAHLGGASGDTWYYPDAALDAGSFESTKIIDDARYSIRSMQVVGNLVIQVGTFSENDYGDPVNSMMWTTDLESGEIVWTSDSDHFMPSIAIQGDTIYAVQTVPDGESVMATLVALSLETGERRFGGIQLPVIESSEDLGPIVVDDLVIVADSLGTTVAVDAIDGTVAWQTEGERGDTPSPSRERPGASGGSIIADDSAVYVVTGANRVRTLDPATGDLKADWDIASGIDFDVWTIGLSLSSSGTLITRMSGAPTTDGDVDDTPQMIPEAIASVDRKHGTIHWIRQLPEVAGNIAVTDDRLVVPTRDSADAPIDLRFMSITSGSDIVVPTVTEARTLSLSATGSTGDTVIFIDSNGVLQIGAMSDTNHYSVVQTLQTRSVAGVGETPPPVVTGGRAVVINDSGRLILLTPDASSPLPQSAKTEMPAGTPTS